VAGTSQILKVGEVLFKQGDLADRMYILRRGQLFVYILNGVEEIPLASLSEGAIVGEMAFFDQKPRSACVRASVPAEVTIITKADFDKLVLQMPKWVLAMMQSLVGRLRQTNDKLMHMEQQLKNMGEAKNNLLPGELYPYQHMVSCLRLLILSLAKDGQKEGTMSVLEFETALKLWIEISAQSKNLFDAVLKICEDVKFLSKKLNAQKIPTIYFLNRGGMTTFSDFCSRNMKFFSPAKTYFTKAEEDFIQMIQREVEASPVETFQINLKNLVLKYSNFGVETSLWEECLVELEKFGFYKSFKNAQDTSLKINTKLFKAFLVHAKTLKVFFNAKLY
jgi:Cyclic nucleotide-binding domain